MIEFIICDDNKETIKKVSDIVDKVMMKNKLQYKKILFYDYDDKFINFIKKGNSLRIYILDIEMPSGSGIDMARVIRNKDVESVIIFLTGHDELGQAILKKELLFLSFINKFEDSDIRLKASIEKGLELLSIKKILRFEDGNAIYTITMKDIVYITKDSYERKSIIKTDNNLYKTRKSLSELLNGLDNRFIRTHRAFIANMDRVVKFDKNKRILSFDNGEVSDLVSNKYSKGLIRYVK